MPTGDQPLVSVVVPAWNAEGTLPETLQSIVRQTYPNIEVIIIDDGSTDATGEIAEQYCSGAANAKLLRQPNRGPAAARNRGIAEARGEWIALLDADDLWHSTKLEKQVTAALATSARPGLVYCWYRRIDEQGLVFDSGPRWAIGGQAFGALAYLHFIRGGSSLLIAKSAIEEVGGFDESFREGCEDVLLELEIARRHPIAVVPEYLFGYRSRENSFTRDFDLLLAGWRRACSAIRERAELPRRTIRWVDAQTNFAVARQRAVERKPRQALAALLSALARDPMRSGAALAEEAVRFVLGKSTRSSDRLERPHFYEIGTEEEFDPRPAAVRRFSAIGDAVDRKRMRTLAAEQRIGRVSLLERHAVQDGAKLPG